MDTRQLAAFCAVVERRSFSQAAELLGVTQPAVSLQVRALEKRLGTQLLDRSGRRVEPTESGLRLYRGAQKLLTLEEQLLDDVLSEATGDLAGTLSLGASTGPAAIVVPQLLCEFQRLHPAVRVALEVHDTRTVVELVADRRLELGIVGATPRHRAVRFEPFAEDEVVLVCPPAHRFAGRTIGIDQLSSETLIVMQEGAGVRRVVEDELRRLGVRLRDLDVRLELGLQESVRSAVLAGYGVTFISRTAVEAELAAGTLAEARVEGMDGRREISIAIGTGRAQPRVVQAFVDLRARARRLRARDRARGAARVSAQAPTRVFRFGAGAFEALEEVCAEVGIARPCWSRVAAVRRSRVRTRSPACSTALRRMPRPRPWSEATALARAVEADGLVGLGGGSAIDTCKAVVTALAAEGAEPLPRVVAVPTTYAGAEWTPFFGTLLEPGRKGGGSDERAAPVAAIYDPELTLDLPLEVTVGTSMNALAHCAEAYYHPARSRRAERHADTGATAIGHALPLVVGRAPTASTAVRVSSRALTAPPSPSRSRDSASATRWRRCSAAATACRRAR